MSQTGKCTKCGKTRPIRAGSGGKCSECQPVRHERIIQGLLSDLNGEYIFIRSGSVEIKFPHHCLPYTFEEWDGMIGKHITLIVNTALEVDDE